MPRAPVILSTSCVWRHWLKRTNLSLSALSSRHHWNTVSTPPLSVVFPFLWCLLVLAWFCNFCWFNESFLFQCTSCLSIVSVCLFLLVALSHCYEYWVFVNVEAGRITHACCGWYELWLASFECHESRVWSMQLNAHQIIISCRSNQRMSELFVLVRVSRFSYSLAQAWIST